MNTVATIRVAAGARTDPCAVASAALAASSHTRHNAATRRRTRRKLELPAASMAMSIAAKLEHEGTARRFRVPLPADDGAVGAFRRDVVRSVATGHRLEWLEDQQEWQALDSDAAWRRCLAWTSDSTASRTLRPRSSPADLAATPAGEFERRAQPEEEIQCELLSAVRAAHKTNTPSPPPPQGGVGARHRRLVRDWPGHRKLAGDAEAEHRHRGDR